MTEPQTEAGRLREALRQVAESEPMSGTWDGWREARRLKDIALAALAATEGACSFRYDRGNGEWSRCGLVGPHDNHYLLPERSQRVALDPAATEGAESREDA